MHQTIGNIIYSGFRGFNLSLFVSLLSSPFFGSGVYLFCVCVSYTFALGSTHFHVPFFSVSCVLLSSFFALFSSVCKSFSFFPFSFTMAFDQTYIHSGLQHIHLCAFRECELNLFAKLFHTFKNYYIKFYRI